MPTTRVRGADSKPDDGGELPDWLGSRSSISSLVAQAAKAGRDWSFGWIGLAADARLGDLIESVDDSGVEILGGVGRLVRARLPADEARLDAIAGLPTVDGIGAIPAATKLRSFANDALDRPVSERIPTFVTLMADDPTGRWRKALEDLGAVVGSYDAALRLYRANVTDSMLESVAAADFVQDVRPIGVVRVAHDTAVPAMGADALRAYDGAPGVFSGAGGASVPIGVMDTGLNINHLDIASHRDSICGANFVRHDVRVDRPEAEDLWIDLDGHGTHVTGTIVGNGTVDRRFAGMAPSVRHLRIAKILNTTGYGDDDAANRGMDYLAHASGCGESGDRKALIVNVSLSANARDRDGRGIAERKLDSIVWNHRQLYVVSQANDDIKAYSEYAAAKNSLAVGAALDSGGLAYFSSRGPTVDGRLAPNVVATGVAVHSARGNASRNQYVRYNGTSMAAPAVAGVAAQLMDAVPAYRERPALTRARLMASAIRPDAWLQDAAAFPLDNSAGPGALQAGYGMGKVSARTSVLDRDEADGWTSGTATAELGDDEYASHEIVVPAGTSRLDLVLTWDEPPAEAIHASVLNDLDLWLDRDGDCETAACGEHVSASRVDNVEWIIVREPEPGTYTAKVVAERVYGASPRAALAWTAIRGVSTPTLSIESDTTAIESDGVHELTLTLTSDAYVAAGTRLHIDCDDSADSGDCDRLSFNSMAVSREDGVSVDLTKDITCQSADRQCVVDSIALGASIPIGEVAVGEAQEVRFEVAVDGEPATARLHFTASAWNAKPGSVSVPVGTGSVDANLSRPANDDFAQAAVIQGEEGSREMSLLGATPEPGEPAFAVRVGHREPVPSDPAYYDYAGRPAGSVWYTWTAPSSGSFLFHVSDSTRDDRYDGVDIYVGGNSISMQSKVASGTWGASVFAVEGTAYRIRVSNLQRGVPVELRWARHAPPDNDDFESATAIEGARGSVSGTSLGATLESGESIGTLAATTWFRWTAPQDGHFFFWLLGLEDVLVFEGDSLASRRLVSARPSGSLSVAARAGAEYRIAVATRGGYAGTGPYNLSWSPRERGGSVDNDGFAAATLIGESASSVETVGIDTRSTVEPGEPAATGVRTRWWAWDAPADDRYTWRVEANSLGRTRGQSFLRVSAFAALDGGDPGLADIELLAQAGPGEPFDFQFDATAGQRYWFAVGLPARTDAAYEIYSGAINLRWGETPENDGVDSASELSGVSGSVSGSNLYATTESGPRAETIGRSTVWWTYEAEADGWMRFSVDQRGVLLTIHGDNAEGELEIVASSRWQASRGRILGASDTNDVLFKATAGVRYTISLGQDGLQRGDDFTMQWEEAEAPSWLHYAGRLADGDHNSAGTPVEIRGPGRMASHASGTPLYLASSIGLQVFERNPSTGRLDFLQLLDVDIARSTLLWDAQRDRLLAEDCGTWRSFAAVVDGTELEDGGELTVEGDPGRCGTDLVADSVGSYIYRVGDGYLDLFSIGETGDLGFVQTHEAGGLKRAVLANDGGRVYAITDDTVLVFERNADTGVLTKKDYEPTVETARAVVISGDDAYLFVLDRSGEQTSVYSLADDDPRYLGSAPRFWTTPSSNRMNECRFADIRDGHLVVDAFCQSSAFTAQWNLSDERAEGTDYIAYWQPDRYNNPIPDFDFPNDMLASTDGRHIYLSTPTQGILIFGRDTSADVDDTGDADLSIQSSWASKVGPVVGTSFTLNAVVRNRGDGPSAATILRAYLSDDTTISSADSEVGSATVAGLDASATRGESITMAAPASPGTYHYGLCVGAVVDESDTSNNCSSAVTVTVMEDPRTPDLVIESPATSPSTLVVGRSFTLTALVANRGDRESAATTLRFYRSTDATIGTDDTEVGTASVAGLAASAESEQSIDLVAPTEPGTYYYGACVDAVAREADTANNCTAGVGITVTGEPDLAIATPTVSDAEPDAGESFTLSVVVSNQGNGESSSTTVRYYRSDDAEISPADTEVGTATVAALSPDANSELSISVEAPSDAGVYYYGACVDAVTDESAAENNCSTAASVTVVVPEPMGQICERVELRRGNANPGTVTIDPADLVETSVGTMEDPFVQEGRIDDVPDFDGYRIVIDSDQRLKIKAEGPVNDTQATLVKDDCTRAARIWNDAEWHENYGGGDYHIYVIGNLAPGAYYLAVGSWNGLTGDYTLKLWAEDQPANEAPEAIVMEDEEIASGDAATVRGVFDDDGGDWIAAVSVSSADESIATAELSRLATDFFGDGSNRLEPWNGGVNRDYLHVNVRADQQGTTTITVTAEDQRGASASTEFEVTVTTPTAPAPTVEAHDETGAIRVSFEATIGAGELRAIDFQQRHKNRQDPWIDSACFTYNDTEDLAVTVRGLDAGEIYEVRFRNRNSDSCLSGDPDYWSALGEGSAGG